MGEKRIRTRHILTGFPFLSVGWTSRLNFFPPILVSFQAPALKQYHIPPLLGLENFPRGGMMGILGAAMNVQDLV